MKKKICKRLKYPYNIKNPDELFDLICFKNWMMGNMNANIPVEESREIFEKIKCLLSPSSEDKE